MNRLLSFMMLAVFVVFGAAASMAQEMQPADTCDNIMPGDANSDGVVNIGDVIYLIKFFNGLEPAPNPLANGDYNGDCVIDSIDIIGAFSYIWKCKKGTKCGYEPPAFCTCQEPEIGSYFQDPCFGMTPGDATGDYNLNVGDAVYIINFIFKHGSYPYPANDFNGDANCDCEVNVADAVDIINIVFNSGDMPCSCSEWQSNCSYISPTFMYIFYNY